MDYKQALGLGFELSSFFLISYVAYPTVAESLGWDHNLTLGLLFGLSLVIWTLHAFLYTNSKSQ